MYDQANDLRRLVRECSTQETPVPGQHPSLIVVTGGKGGVGTTTIAVNLAMVFHRTRLRTVLVDADPRRGNVALLCGIEERYTLADVLSGRRTVPEVLQLSPGAVPVLPGIRALERLSDYPPAAGERLLAQLFALDTQTDLLVVDAGNTADEMTRRFCRAADLILVVTTPETPAVLDTYASIKTLPEIRRPATICSLVNRAPGTEVAADVHRRLKQASRRFLGMSLQDAGHVPPDAQVAAAANAGEPLVAAAAGCPAARKIERLTQTLADLIGNEQTSGMARNSKEGAPARMTA